VPQAAAAGAVDVRDRMIYVIVALIVEATISADEMVSELGRTIDFE